MELIAWNKTYSLGISQIDEEHKRLFALINHLFEGVQLGHANEAIGEAIKGLVNYTVYHFTAEEKFFEICDYSGKAEHKAKHDAFIKKIFVFQADYSSGKQELARELIYFVQDWIIDHVKIEDSKYVTCFKEHGIS